MPSDKSKLIPKRKLTTDGMPAIKISDVAPERLVDAPNPSPTHAPDFSAKFDALHARFDTLEMLIRDALATRDKRIDGNDRRLDGHDKKLEDHEKRIRDLERGKKGK